MSDFGTLDSRSNSVMGAMDQGQEQSRPHEVAADEESEEGQEGGFHEQLEDKVSWHGEVDDEVAGEDSTWEDHRHVHREPNFEEVAFE